MPSKEHFKGDYAPKPDQLDISSELPVPELPIALDVTAQSELTEPTPNFVVPESIRPRVEADQAEAEARFDRVDAQGQTTNAATRERAGIMTPEDEDARAVRAARKMLATNPSTKKKPTRRGLGSRQLLIADGPPAHVAREIREGLPPEDKDPEAA